MANTIELHLFGNWLSGSAWSVGYSCQEF